MSENYGAVIGVFCAGVGVVALALYCDGRVPDTDVTEQQPSSGAGLTATEFREHLLSSPLTAAPPQPITTHNNPSTDKKDNTYRQL